jgi:hypothetical protein
LIRFESCIFLLSYLETAHIKIKSTFNLRDLKHDEDSSYDLFYENSTRKSELKITSEGAHREFCYFQLSNKLPQWRNAVQIEESNKICFGTYWAPICVAICKIPKNWITEAQVARWQKN